MKQFMILFAVMLTALGLHADTTTVYRDSSGRTTGTSTERRNADGPAREQLRPHRRRRALFRHDPRPHRSSLLHESRPP